MSQYAITQFAGKYAFLSNFYPCWVEYEGTTYPTVEHAYQAAKTLDKKKREWVRFATTPGMAKRRGRTTQLRPNWEALKEPTMWYLLTQKFGPQNPGLVQRLRATDGLQLIEGNNWGDTFWGVCKGVGYNRLGHMLMAIRASRIAERLSEASKSQLDKLA